MSPYRDPVKTDPRIPPERLDALLALIERKHPFLAFAGVGIRAEPVAGGVLLIAYRQGIDEDQSWFSASTKINDISAWCHMVENKLRVHQETIGVAQS